MRLKQCALALGVALSLAGNVASADHQSAAFDVNKPAWFNGSVVETFAVIPKPDGSVAPSPERKDVKAYLVGNIYAGSPFGPEVTVQTPFGSLVVPAHDDVFSGWSTESKQADAFGFWIVPGPAGLTDGPDQNVRVRPMPAGSLAGAPLAYAVKYEGKWYALTNAKVIERAVDYGLLAEVPSGPGGGFGGIGWLEPAIKFFD